MSKIRKLCVQVERGQEIFMHPTQHNNGTFWICSSEQSLGLVPKKLEMLANAQRDGRPAEYRWRRLFNAAKFG